MKKKLLGFIFLFILKNISAQSTFVPLGNDEYWLMDRAEIMSGNFLNQKHTSHKPYLRGINVDAVNLQTDKRGLRNVDYIVNENAEFYETNFTGSKKPILKHFYKTKADLYSTQSNDFMLKLNPVLYFGYGKEQNDGENLFINSRGAELRGWIAKRVGFYLIMTDNQERMPNYVQVDTKKHSAVMGEGYWKKFKNTGYDFFNTRGYFTVTAAKFINIQFGQDKNFIGNGYRSLFLSDNSDDYLFLKLNTQVWKISYENIFTDLTGNALRKGDTLLPRRYAAFHHLSLNFTKFLNIGLFESVIFHRNNSYDIAYLNPLIFYRAVEQGLGSPDNAFVGADFKLNALHHVSLYGQFLLDDLNFFEFKNHKGYWGTKFGGQLGAKYINAFGIKHLDLQGEFNAVRPYTFSHSDTLANYSNYNQPLAHPLGANFEEVIGILRYQATKNFFIEAKLFADLKGEDSLSKKGAYVISQQNNNGGNILAIANVKTIPHVYNNSIGQGISTKWVTANLSLNYMLKQNIFLTLDLLYRKYDSSKNSYDLTTMSAMFSLRVNMPQRHYDF